MADTRFYRRAGPFTLAELARVCGASLAAGTDGDRSVEDVAPIDAAQAHHISFLDNRKYAERFMVSRAGACIIHPDYTGKAPSGMGLLVTPQPYHAYARVAAAFYPEVRDQSGISSAAIIDASAIIGPEATIEAGAVIGADVTIGARSVVGSNAVLHRGVVIGDDTVIGSNVTVSHAIIGSRVVLFPGVRIGQDGFGYAMGTVGHLKVPQLGRVVVEDDVEIGANSTIDRGSGPDTVIGAGTKIDNLVQIGHNVEVGRGCVVVAQAGISGSTHLGDFVVLGGQVGVIGHLRIGSGARIGGQSGVTRDVAAGATMGGSPAVTMTQWLRQSAELARLVRKKNR